MKRSWLGFGLLLVLMVLGLVVTFLMTEIHDPISADLKQAGACVLLGDWDNGEKFFQEANSAWEKWSHFRTCFADHTPTEEIDALFAQVQVYGNAREDVAFAAGCQELARKVAAVGEAHGVYWWNVL